MTPIQRAANAMLRAEHPGFNATVTLTYDDASLQAMIAKHLHLARIGLKAALLAEEMADAMQAGYGPHGQPVEFHHDLCGGPRTEWPTCCRQNFLDVAAEIAERITR